ncbi:MAG: glycine reductase, partial [Ruthenibacterium sp.]
MNSVIKGTGYVLAHVPSMVAVSGTTQSTERIVNPDSDYLRALSSHLRTYEQAVAYAPNQTYIGSITPEQLREMPQPWYENDCPNAARAGRFGEIMPEAEFLLLMQLCDAFDLVRLERGFVAATRPALAAHPLMTEEMLALL